MIRNTEISDQDLDVKLREKAHKANLCAVVSWTDGLGVPFKRVEDATPGDIKYIVDLLLLDPSNNEFINLPIVLEIADAVSLGITGQDHVDIRFDKAIIELNKLQASKLASNPSEEDNL